MTSLLAVSPALSLPPQQLNLCTWNVPDICSLLTKNYCSWTGLMLRDKVREWERARREGERWGKGREIFWVGGGPGGWGWLKAKVVGKCGVYLPTAGTTFFLLIFTSDGHTHTRIHINTHAHTHTHTRTHTHARTHSHTHAQNQTGVCLSDDPN